MTSHPVFSLICVSIATFLSLCIDQVKVSGQEELPTPQAEPLNMGLAENDQAQEKPLMKALSLGFRSIEIDVYAVGNTLHVGNSILDMKSQGLVENLYFRPLMDLHEKKSELIQNRNNPLILFINQKSDGANTYRVLKTLLNKYSAMLTSFRNDQVTLGSVTVLVGGDVPRDTIAKENPRFVACDGHMTDVDNNISNLLVPTVTLRWWNHFKWTGKTDFYTQEKARLNSIVERVHASQRKIRFSATPDSEIVWAALKEAKVDWIGGERYDELHKFLAPPRSPFESDESK